MKIPIKLIEDVTGYKVKKNTKSLGIDLAVTCGICLIKTNDKEATLDYSTIQFSHDINKRYNQMVDMFKLLIQDKTFVVLEDTFIQFGKNVKGMLTLTRLGGIPLCLCILKKDEGVEWTIIGAKSARSKLGINTFWSSPGVKTKSGETKKIVIKWLNDNFKLNIQEDNQADSTVLGILGILEGMNFESQEKIKKQTKRK